MNQSLSNILSSPLYLLHVLFSAFIGYWVYLDATERESNASYLWAIGCTVFQPLVIGYLLFRSQIGGRREPAEFAERAVGSFIVGHLIAVQLWFVLRYFEVIPTANLSPIIEFQYYVALFVVGVLPGYWLVWKRGWARIRRSIGWIQESEHTDVQN